MLRPLVEHFSRNVVLNRRLPKEFGAHPILVSPDSALQYWKPGLASVDPELIDVVRRFIKPGTVVWDIGANVGLFSFSAAAKGAKVFAVEADGFLVSLLRRSHRRNGLDVTPIPLAVTDHVGLAGFNIAQRGRSTNHIGIGMSDAGGIRWQETTPCATLDWLAEQIPPPDFIKIDVEGLENAVLRGGPNLLRTRHPRIFCEVSEDTDSRTETTRLLLDFGYRLFNVKNNSWVERAVFSTLAICADL